MSTRSMFDAMVEATALKSAEHIHISEWGGPALWSDEAGQSFENYDAFTDWYSERCRLPPDHAWECVRGRMTFDAAAGAAIDFIMKDTSEIDPLEVSRLRIYLRSWMKARDIRTMGWIKGNKRVVVLRHRIAR